MKEKTKKPPSEKQLAVWKKFKEGKSKPFSKENQPSKRGRTKGIKNRDTVIREFLEAILIQDGKKIKNPITGQKEMSILEGIVAKQISKALGGDRKSAELMLDYAYGKAKGNLTIETSGGRDFNSDPVSAEEAARQYHDLLNEE